MLCSSSPIVCCLGMSACWIDSDGRGHQCQWAFVMRRLLGSAASYSCPARVHQRMCQYHERCKSPLGASESQLLLAFTQIVLGQALDKASPVVPTLEQIKSAVDATANGWDMPTTIAAVKSSASNHVSLQKCNVSISVDVVCQHS